MALAGTTLAGLPSAHAFSTEAGAAASLHHNGAGKPGDAPMRGVILLAAEGGEGGEGGGESGGGGEGGEGGGVAPEAGYSLNSTNPGDYKYDATAEIAAYAAGVSSSYEASVAEAKKLQSAVNELLANPTDAALAAARRAWVVARPAYLVTEAYRFYDGPIEELEGQINAWPMNEAFVDYVEGNPKAGIINDGSEISIKEIIARNQVSDENDVTTGWHAIEFLLWGQDLNPDGPGNRPASDYVAGKDNNDRRRAYLLAVTDQLVADIETVAGHWQPGSGDYAGKFVALPPREAIGRILNGVAVLAGFEFMSERLAVGLDSGDQEDEHSCFSDTTHQDFVYDLKGIENVWTGAHNGAPGAGLKGLVEKVDPATAAEIDGLLADATAKLAALGDPWDKVLATPEGSPERAKGEEAVAALQALGAGFKTVGAKLGVLVQIPSG
ncbi:MAG: imelysin family protein [Bauldia sp.]